ncbi:response regulator [Rhizobium sullae]|uniref:response regulator n=1 Tax=Rhizobium sullae TaxID=50338 RepID=UPI000B351717|nr:response regulator [Rhizobium sullae]
MIYGFAKQSGGHASIYSEEGKGTTVNIYLLRHVTTDAAIEANSPDVTAMSGDGECILAVEDDDRVRRLTVARLKQLGYRVLEAENGAEALTMLASNPNIDLLFTDLVMPGSISGYQLCQEARKLYPGLKALLTSGYAEELVQSDRLGGENLKVLRKPYRQTDLAKAIGEALRGE